MRLAPVANSFKKGSRLIGLARKKRVKCIFNIGGCKFLSVVKFNTVAESEGDRCAVLSYRVFAGKLAYVFEFFIFAE